MTENQIRFMANVETKRANRAYETETHRSNLARERENYRTNTNHEAIGWFNAMETKRSNISNEQRYWYHEQWSRQVAFLDYERKLSKDESDIAQGWANVEVRRLEAINKTVETAFKVLPIIGAALA